MLRLLLENLRSKAQFGLRVELQAQPAVRAVSGWWEYSSEQQDAAEYMGVVLGSSGALSNVWCSRRELDGHVSTTDRGQALLLEMSTPNSDLQALLDAWQHQEHVHALSDQQDLVPVQIGRYCGGRKNQAPLLFTEDVAVPVFSQGMRCLRTFYRPVAAVIHLGPECKSGHYRSLLRLGDD